MPRVAAAPGYKVVELDYGITVTQSSSINVDLNWPLTAAALIASKIVVLDSVSPPGAPAPQPGLTGGTIGGICLEGCGYSWMNGSYSSDPGARYITRLAKRLGAHERVYALGSSVLAYYHLAGAPYPDGKRGHNGWATILQRLRRQHHPYITNYPFTAPFKAASQLVVFHYGYADLGSYANESLFKESMRTIIRRYRAAAVFEDSHPSVVFSSGWTTATSRDSNSGDGRRYTNTNGSTVTITVPPAPAGNFTVVLGGVNASAFNQQGGLRWTVNGQSVGSKIVAAGSDAAANVSPTVFVIPNVPAGATLVGTLNTADGPYGHFDYWSIEAPDPPLVLVALEPRMPDYGMFASGWGNGAGVTDATVQSHNTAKKAVVNEFTDGRVLAVDLDAAFNKNTAYFGPYENGHPNDAGERLLADTFEPVILNNLSPSSVRDAVVPSEDEGWILAGTLNNWVPFTTQPPNAGAIGDPPPRFRRTVDGDVILSGAAKSGSTAGAVIMNLGIGYRPRMTRRYICSANGAASEVTVDPSGDVKAATGGSVTRQSLDGIRFSAQA